MGAMNKNKTDELPEGWVKVALNDIAEILMGQSPPSETYNSEGIGLPFFQGKAEFTDLHPVAEKWCRRPNKIAEAEDILISVRAPVGTTNIANQKCCIGRGLAAIRYNQNTKFLFYFLRLIERTLDEKGTGTTFKAISGEVLRNIDVPLPPLPEQHAIVSRIEQLFSELDKGIESLKTAQQQLKVYRQSVLKWAFEGKLTERWRQNQDLPDAQALLEKIQKEREEKVKASGKKQKTVAPRTKKELDALPELPKGWGWVKFGEVVDEFIRGPFGSALKKEFFVEHGYKVYEQQNAIYKTIEFGRYFISDEKFQELRRFETKPDDYIVSCSGTIGKLYKLPINAPKGLINQALLIIRIRRTMLRDKYFSYLFTSTQFQRLIIKDAKGTAMLNLAGVKELELVPFPICSLPEQHQIVQEIESRLSECDNMEATITASLQQAEALRQSILKKAFEGRLLNEKELEAVRQDPAWEPAEKMLERIQAEKAGLQPKKPGWKGKVKV